MHDTQESYGMSRVDSRTSFPPHFLPLVASDTDLSYWCAIRTNRPSGLFLPWTSGLSLAKTGYHGDLVFDINLLYLT